MSSLNKVTLIGYVGGEPTVIATDDKSGNKVVKFTLATSENYTTKSGEKQSDTEWHNIVCYGNLAEIVEKYVKKGKQLYVEGKIKSKTVEKNNEKKIYTNIVMNNMVLLGKKDDASSFTEQNVNGYINSEEKQAKSAAKTPASSPSTSKSSSFKKVEPKKEEPKEEYVSQSSDNQDEDDNLPF